MTKPEKLAHAVLRTGQYEAVVKWWSRALDATPRFANDFLTFLSYDDEHHRLAIANVPGLPEAPAGAIGVDHLAFTFATIDDLLSKYSELKAAGVEPVWMVDHGMTISAYYEDPDDNRVEFQVDVCSLEEADAFMRSEHFAANPIGVDIEFDELIQRRNDGATTADLARITQLVS